MLNLSGKFPFPEKRNVHDEKSIISEPIRVLQVFASLDSGGVSNFVMNLYRCMDRDRIQFDFALTAGEKALYDEEVLELGGRIFYFDPSIGMGENLQWILQKEGPFYAVHSHVFFYSGAVLVQAKKAAVPVRIAHAHNAYTGGKRTLSRFFYENSMRFLILHSATSMIGCSEKACRFVFGNRSLQDRRASVIPDGIDCERFAFDAQARACVRREYCLDEKFVVGHVGHFNAAKNHEKILSIFAEVCRRREDAALLLVGDGELEQEVRNKAAQWGLSNRVVFAGAHKDVERFYQAMDVFLFPSRYEGFGMAMIEAQARGLVCVASDIVPRETNADGRAVYLPLEVSDSDWADQVIEAGEQKQTEEGLRRVALRFGVQITAEKVRRLYLNGKG